MREIALIALLATIPVYSYAEQCGENKTSLAINECLMQKVEASEQRLTAYLSRIRKKYSDEPKTLSLLDNSQSMWRSFREQFCRSVYQEFAEGTVGNSIYARCKLQQTDRRTHDLWEWYLTYWDSTPPDLQEPLMATDDRRHYKDSSRGAHP